MTLSLVEYEMMLDDVAYLEADLSDCETRLGWATETPPECQSSGVPLWTVLVSFAVGVVVAQW